MKDASDAKDTQAQQQQKFDVENEKNKRAASEKNSFGRDLNARFDKWTSQRSEKGTSKGRGCDNCNGMGQIRVQDGFFTQANACPDCS
jgi:DnaJ-class molecular chaperone